MTNDVEMKIDTVKKYVKAFETQDMDIIRNIYAEDAVIEDPVGSDPYEGIEEICKFYQTAFYLETKLELNGQVRCARNICAFPFTATTSGVKVSPIDVFEFNDQGKVIRMKAYWGKENIV